MSDNDYKDIVYPIPFSNGRIVTIRNLPLDLSKADAEKIGAVVRALAKPEQLVIDDS